MGGKNSVTFSSSCARKTVFADLKIAFTCLPRRITGVGRNKGNHALADSPEWLSRMPVRQSLGESKIVFLV